MNTYLILTSKHHNPHYLNRYIKFIDYCAKINPEKFKGHKHHICPKANDLFPEYADFKSNDWNKIKLTYRQHVIAHMILWKTFGGSQINAFHAMIHTKEKHKINSRLYAKLMSEHSFKVGELNKLRVLSQETKDKIGDANRGNMWSDERKQDWASKMSGVGNNAYGSKHPHSDESKQKISKAITGQLNHFYGKNHSVDTKKKLSKARLNKVSAFDISNNTFVQITSEEFKSLKGTKYVGLMHSLARAFRNNQPH